MLKFFETPSATLFERSFVLQSDGETVGSAKLVYVPIADTQGLLEVRDFYLMQYEAELADLLAGAMLNAACNTEVGRVRVEAAPHWARFGLEQCGQGLEQDTDKIVFDSVCRSQDCANCENKCRG